MLNNILAILNCAAIIVASAAAFCGINSWRKELKWKKKNELAEEVYYLLRQCRDSINAIRSPLEWSNEGKTRKQNPNEAPELKESLDKAYILNERYENNREHFNKLFSLKYRASLYFGREVNESIDTIEKVVKDLLISSYLLGNIYWPRLGKTRDEKENEELRKKINEQEDIFWKIGKNDKVTNKIDQAIENCEKELKKCIR